MARWRAAGSTIELRAYEQELIDVPPPPPCMGIPLISMRQHPQRRPASQQRPTAQRQQLQATTQGLGVGRLGAIPVVRNVASRNPGPSISVKLRDLDAGCSLVGQLSKVDLSIREGSWQTGGGSLQITLQVLFKRAGSPLLCRLRSWTSRCHHPFGTIMSYHGLQITHGASFIVVE